MRDTHKEDPRIHGKGHDMVRSPSLADGFVPSVGVRAEGPQENGSSSIVWGGPPSRAEKAKASLLLQALIWIEHRL